MRIAAAGEKPLRSLSGRARNHFALAEFANVATFDTSMQRLADADLHRLREGATANYIWTLYEPRLFGD